MRDLILQLSKSSIYSTKPVGYVNSVEKSAIEALGIIKSLSSINQLDTITALNLMLKYGEEHGASNFLSYKLAYLRSARELSSSELKIATQIEDEFKHRERPGFHFSALENLNSRISLFVVARRRVSALIGKVNGNIRKAISLNNFIPTPVSMGDLSDYLLRASESALLDTIYSIIVIFNLDDEFEDAKNELRNRLSAEFQNCLHELLSFTATIEKTSIVTDYYHSLNEDGDFSLDLYRNAAAFLERKDLALYRNKLDKVIGNRLLSEIENKQCSFLDDFHEEKKLLLSDDGEEVKGSITISLDTFYRTYLFLKIIKNKSNLLLLSGENIKFIFEHTLRLDTLLTEDEITTIYLTAPEETKSLVTVLTLALYRKKSADPDVDFEFRGDFISYVKEKFNGSIVSFISDLLEKSPAIASYIVVSLDEVTLEKMYGLVLNASDASSIRCDILKLVGKKLNQIEYIIEAESIITREKVSILQKYFDSSRIYVDSVSMKKWLDSNPTMSTEQYRSLYSQSEAIISTPSTKDGIESNVLYIQLINRGDYLIPQIAKDAFEQFCLNNEFGIQSYLGRRIRHNTLDGVTTDTVDSVLRKPEHRIVLANLQMQRTVASWLSSYKAIVDKLRREYLQFRASNSLFNAVIDIDDPATIENIRLLTNTLRSTGRSELLNDLIIAFCWKQITPQLENAARFIRTTLLQEAKDSIDKHFTVNHSAGESQIVAELHEAVNEVFVKVSDWFQVPETGFISASIRNLCTIILLELNRKNKIDFNGEAVDNKYTGISVHRLYDCLAVLLQNAHKHGEDDTIIKVNVNAKKNDSESVLESVTIDITSKVSQEKMEKSKDRIEKAISAEEDGKDMVTEGYSGIKKIKFITRVSEGVQTMIFKCNKSENELTLGFTIHAELATDDNPTNSGVAE
ncbi:hypothetical protein [Mixta mediterraneensis]|uniref:hypothetical protein n=1 Tax=Mixta mediterraneensis TaxID=2758443 RepID=UPI001EEE795A|nr:hypothetical protein [Mixta mediterraneensis]